MPYCTRIGLSKPYSLTRAACRTSSMPRPPPLVSIGGPGPPRHGFGRVPRPQPHQEEREQRHPDEGRNDERNAGEEETQHRGNPRLFLVSEFASQDLAHRRLRQLGAELHHLGLLVAGEVSAAILAHLLLREVGVLL